MITIEPAIVQDAAGIAEVYVDTWRSAYPALLPHSMLLGMSYERQTREWSSILRRPTEAQSIIVAVEGDRAVVGFTSFGPSRFRARPAGGTFASGRGDNLGEVYTLYVRPELQERGIGRRLLFAAFGAMIAKGYNRAFLWVIRDNPSRFFYERVGGKAVAERREHLWGGIVDQVCYGWPDLNEAVDALGPSRT